jgi:hypothetical protein
LDAALFAIRLALAAVFIPAGLAKLLNREAFARAVANYRLLPPAAVRPVARTLPVLELGAGLLLLAGLGTRLVAATLAVLLVAFALAVSVNLLRGRRIDCGCFTGPGPREITWATVARNAGLSAVAVWLAAAQPATLGGSDSAAVAVLTLTLLLSFRLAGAALTTARADAALTRALAPTNEETRG